MRVASAAEALHIYESSEWCQLRHQSREKQLIIDGPAQLEIILMTVNIVLFVSDVELFDL